MDNPDKPKGQSIKNGQPRDTGNIGYTSHRTKVRENQRDNREWTTPEDTGQLATLNGQPRDTQDWVHKSGQRLEKTKETIKNGQPRDTGNIGYIRHRTKGRENQRDNQEWTI